MVGGGGAGGSVREAYKYKDLLKRKYANLPANIGPEFVCNISSP